MGGLSAVSAVPASSQQLIALPRRRRALVGQCWGLTPEGLSRREGSACSLICSASPMRSPSGPRM
jgi:hypothetical protein